MRPFPPVHVCVGFSGWKRAPFKALFAEGGRPPAFTRDAEPAIAAARARGGAIAVWASREPAGLRALAKQAGVAVLGVEDGFLRSTGLGSDFVAPASVVLDGRGMYYDPAQPSDLETIFAEQPFSSALLDRAAGLVRTIREARLSKYNLASTSRALPRAAGRPTILVPGQVSDDRSVLLGGCGLATNAQLLAEVRALRPDGFIVYKPHPDVEAGHRAGHMPDAEALRHADAVVRDIGVIDAIDEADEVHTLTSLTGFEALLRGKPVTTYGQPFYAGWGLTADIRPVARRTRRLSLEQLVAGALILYPVYLDPLTWRPCEVEDLIEVLKSGRRPRTTTLIRLRRLQGRIKAPLKRIGL